MELKGRTSSFPGLIKSAICNQSKFARSWDTAPATEQDLLRKDQRFTLNSSPCVLPEPKRIPLYIQDSLEDCTPPSELLMLSPTTCLNFFSKAAPANTPRTKQMKRVLHEASNAGFFKMKLKPQGLSFRNPYPGLETCQEGRA